jgi:hypothetical protein
MVLRVRKIEEVKGCEMGHRRLNVGPNIDGEITVALSVLSGSNVL